MRDCGWRRSPITRAVRVGDRAKRGRSVTATAILGAALLAGCGSPATHAAPRTPATGTGLTGATSRSAVPTVPSSPPVTPAAPPAAAPPAAAPPVPVVSPPRTAVPTSPSLPVTLLGRVVSRIPTNQRVVALTFDAGANGAGAPAILATLRSTNVPATFFLTGNFVTAYPSLARQLAAAGRVGDHSVNHPHLPALTEAQIRTQVTAAQRAIVTVTGAQPSPLFRFPYGDSDARTIRIVNGLGFIAVGWTVDTLGWKGSSAGITADSIVSRVLASRTPGEIVLMHVGSNPDDNSTLDADALPRVIAGLRAAGYSFVTLDALLH